MNFQQLRDRTEALCKLEGWTNVQPEPDFADLVNIGNRRFTEVAQHNVEDTTITTVNGTAEYSLPTVNGTRDWILLYDDATYGTTRRIYQTSPAKLRRENRLWRQAAAGTTSRWFISKPNTVRLFPAPDTDGDTVYFEGVRHEPLLSADTDVPLSPSLFHEGICLYAAWHWGKLYARGEGRAVVGQYLSEAKAHADALRAQMVNQDAAVLQRRVERGVPDYLVLTTFAPTQRGQF